MSIEDTLAAILAAQERTATAMEALLAFTQGQTALSFPGSTGEAPPAEEKKPTTRKAPAKKEEEPAPPPAAEEPDPLDDADPLDEAEETFTEDQVRAALKDYRDINGGDAVMAILEKHGAKGMGSLKKEHYAAVMKEVR